MRNHCFKRLGRSLWARRDGLKVSHLPEFLRLLAYVKNSHREVAKAAMFDQVSRFAKKEYMVN